MFILMQSHFSAVFCCAFFLSRQGEPIAEVNDEGVDGLTEKVAAIHAWFKPDWLMHNFDLTFSEALILCIAPPPPHNELKEISMGIKVVWWTAEWSSELFVPES